MTDNRTLSGAGQHIRAGGLPAPSDLAAHWAHDPSIVFLNHGSFGGTPRVMQEAQTRWREQLEREPVDFFVNQHWGVMDAARAALSPVVHAPEESLALVPNATIGVATVLANLRLAPGDEVLTNNHEYPACQNNLRRAAARQGAAVVVAEVPFPCTGPRAVIDALLAKVTPRTRAALISHVTSPSGLIFPVEELAAEFRRRGIVTIIDGAHAPGMVALDIGKINPDFYTANCHKWLCSPKGSAFLYVSAEQRAVPGGFRPVILSNNAENGRAGRSQFHTDFDYIGTNDCTSLYTIPDAIDFIASIIPGGLAEVMRRNHDLVIRGRDILCEALGITPPAPDCMIGSICTLILPPHEAAHAERLKQRPTRYHDALQDALIDRHRIQVPVWGLPDKPARFIRISAQLYNSVEQYACLAGALKEELERERLL